MNEFTHLFLIAIIGFSLGVFFYAGLWWTVQKCVSSDHVALLFLSSLLIRMATVLSGFYFMMKQDWLIPSWQGLVFCLVTFALARYVVTRVTYTKPKASMRTHKDTTHAS